MLDTDTKRRSTNIPLAPTLVGPAVLSGPPPKHPAPKITTALNNALSSFIPLAPGLGGEGAPIISTTVAFPHPGGIPACSRWLSEARATPPVTVPHSPRTPAGVPARFLQSKHLPNQFPAALNHALHSPSPSPLGGERAGVRGAPVIP